MTVAAGGVGERGAGLGFVDLIEEHARLRLGAVTAGAVTAGAVPAGAAPGGAVDELRGLDTGSVRLVSPSCGDEITVSFVPARVPGGELALRWDGRGCTVSQSSASMLAGLVAEQRLDGSAVKEAIEFFLAEMASRRRRPASAAGGTASVGVASTASAAPTIDLGDAPALYGVAGNPVRSSCATLAWRAALAALPASALPPAASAETAG